MRKDDALDVEAYEAFRVLRDEGPDAVVQRLRDSGRYDKRTARTIVRRLRENLRYYDNNTARWQDKLDRIQERMDGKPSRPTKRGKRGGSKGSSASVESLLSPAALKLLKGTRKPRGR